MTPKVMAKYLQLTDTKKPPGHSTAPCDRRQHCSGSFPVTGAARGSAARAGLPLSHRDGLRRAARNSQTAAGDMEAGSAAGLQPGLGAFYYFAYGSNLLRERIRLDNPTAACHSIAALQDFKLAFGNHNGHHSSRWHGGVATVVESEGDKVWGVVWKMDISNLDSLDSQEGVAAGIYQPIEISVQTPDGELVCRSYKMNKCIYALMSPQYKQVMCMGAKQNNLPRDYQKMLGELETNNYSGPVAIMDKLKDAIRRVQEDGCNFCNL